MRSTSRDNQKTTGPSLAQVTGQAELQRVRKDLIQSKAALSDLQEELEEKNRLYLDAVKARDEYKTRLNNAKDNINRVQDIVQQKVSIALENERKELIRLRADNQRLQERVGITDNNNKTLNEEKKQLLDKIHGLNEDLAFYSRNVDARDTMKRIDILRAEKDNKDKKITELLHDINELSLKVEDFIAENRALRQMANVPDNYGIKLDQIKLHDKEKIDDFKKLIKVLQDDNYKLEEERAKLKHALKVQSMMYKSTDPSERFKGLTQDQLMTVDQFVLRLLTGDASDPSDAYQLRRENESLKAQMEALNAKGFDVISQQVKQIFKDKKFDDNSSQLGKLIQDNEELRLMIARLFEQGVAPGYTSGSAPMQGGGSFTMNRSQISNTQFRAPQPSQPYDGEIRDGTSFKFGGSNLQVTDKEGNAGIGSSSVYEHAFLHLQLQESLELIKRKDENALSMQNEIDGLYKRVRSYILTQDQLYKDFVRMERMFKKREDDLRAQFRSNQDLVMEEQTKVQKLEAALKTMQAGPDAVQSRLIELTKQNSILDVNLLRLTRKYQSLEEQEKLLRREFHNKDDDAAEKDLHIQQRINSLKEWKARAIQQLKFQHQKLRMAIPISEYQVIQKQLEVAKQRQNELVLRNSKLVKQISECQKKLRDNMEAEEQLKYLQELKDEVEEEHEIVKKRLEAFDPVFRWENQVFSKIALIIKRSKISPVQAFEEFDRSKDGNLQRQEFIQALEMLKIYDLSAQELDVLWDSFDADRSGSINYKEFARKLERYGVKNRSREETIIYQMIDAVQRSKVKSLNGLFELIDKSGRGFISRDDFSDIFQSLNLRIDQQELDKFMDNFWKDKDAGIDYQGFLRIFGRYQVRMNKEQNAQTGPKIATDETIRKKKSIYDQINRALIETGRTLPELFRKIDSDQSRNIGPEELLKMFKSMQLEISSQQSVAVFDSIDFDGNGEISLPEFVSDFKMVCASSLEELIREEHQKAQNNQKAQMAGAASVVPKGVINEIQMQTKVDIMQARERQLQRKIDTQMRILQNSEKSIHFLQAQYDQAEQQLNDITVTNYEMKERVIYLENELKTCIRKDNAEALEAQNERLLTELAETRAGMLSYKNMTMVIAEQAKNLKLIHERKKDENDNLLNALRETQSEGVTQERLGKLYFIIMLSRWQEASVNKKYDLVLNEVRELRNECIVANQMVVAKEVEHQEAETILQKYQLDLEKLKQQASQGKGAFISQNQVVEFNQIIQDLNDQKTDLEEAHMKLRTQYRLAQDKLDTSEAKSEHAQTVLNQLQRAKPSELSDRLVEMSEKLQQIRLNEYRANRKADEFDERLKYLSNLLKSKTEAILQLEEKASKAESQMFKQEEEFRKRDIERQRQFFYINKFEDGGEHRGPTQAKQAGRQLSSAANLTNNGSAPQRLDMQALNQYNTLTKNQDYQAAWTKGQVGSDNQEKIQRLESAIEELNLKLIQKDQQIQRFEQWQIGDKYLSQDEVLKDAIQEHRTKTTTAQEKEHKEMMEAAYQTIKTLQDMLDVKNQAIRSKEEQVVKMRQQVASQRELDAHTIQQLRDQISFTGNSTLAKMQEIVSKHDVAQTVQSQKQTANSSKLDRLSLKEFERQLQEKDHIIQQLRARTEGHKSETDHYSKKREERLDEISSLKNELAREKARNDVSVISKRLEKVQSERKQQDETIKALNKAIDSFKDQMTKFSSQKSNLEEENEIVKKKEEFNTVTLKKEIENLKNKVTLVENSRDQKVQELKQIKVSIAQLEASNVQYKTELEDLKAKYNTALSNLETERRSKAKIQAELNGYKEDAKIGGNVGGKVSYDQLLQRNQELEQDNKILECQKKTVVVYNKESGAFEYIGESRPLDYTGDLTTVQDILSELEKWLKLNPRLTVSSIFRSLDKGNFGELNEQDMARGFAKIGVNLKPQELRLLREKLDPRSVGYLKIDPLIRQLQGIPTQDFLLRPIQKLAMLVESRDLNRSQFRTLVDQTHAENVSLDQFQKAMSELKSEDFVISSEEVEQIFKFVAKVQKTIGVQMSVSKLVDQVFYALHAVIIERMKDGLRRSGKYTSDLLLKYDNNKDGFLSYHEMESLLLELQVSFKTNTFNEILIAEILDPHKKQTKISFEIIKWFIGDQAIGSGAPKQFLNDGKSLDLLPSLDSNQNVKGNLTDSQFEICRQASRKISAHIAQLSDVLSAKDPNRDGFLQNDDVAQAITDRRVPDLQPSELQLLLSYCDRDERGFVVISSFCHKISELMQETESEVQLRRFAKTIGHQGINLKAELSNYEAKNGKLDKNQFKKAIKNLSVSTPDAEIDILFASSQVEGLLDIKTFLSQVQAAGKIKPLPAQNQQVNKTKVQFKVGQQGTKPTGETQSGAFEQWEIEKKYKKNLDALKQEIEERNREIQMARKEVKDTNERAQKIENEKRLLEARLVDKSSKPPRQTQVESTTQGSLEEIQKLRDEIYHCQQVNQALNKTIQVDLKAELGRLTSEKDFLEQKLKTSTEKVRAKAQEVQQLIGRPMDQLVRREEREEQRQKQIDELTSENQTMEQQVQQLRDKLFKAEERLLDLKFEKETFDLQYARLQKRITDLEQYKFQSSQISAVMRNQFEEEIAKIQEQTNQLRGDSLAKQPSDSVKLRAQTSKTAQELEIVIESLKRVIEKQKVDNDNLKKQNERLAEQASKKSNEPALRQKVEQLERVVHSYEMQDVNMDEKDQTIKKLVFANKTLREDLAQEIERFNLLQSKFRDLLIKYNIASKENSKNQKSLFEVTTGAHMHKYENFLDEDGEFYKKSVATEDPGDAAEQHGDDLNDSLNKINRADARGGRTH